MTVSPAELQAVTPAYVGSEFGGTTAVTGACGVIGDGGQKGGGRTCHTRACCTAVWRCDPSPTCCVLGFQACVIRAYATGLNGCACDQHSTEAKPPHRMLCLSPLVRMTDRQSKASGCRPCKPVRRMGRRTGRRQTQVRRAGVAQSLSAAQMAFGFCSHTG